MVRKFSALKHLCDGLFCPGCQSADSAVLESRALPYGVRRRRECSVCSRRYSTIEVFGDVVEAKLRRLERLEKALALITEGCVIGAVAEGEEAEGGD